jgi:hypothetical protein
LTFEYLKQSLWNLVCISWHLSPSQLRTSWMPPISLCVCICVPHTVARSRLGKHVPTKMNTSNNSRIVGRVIFRAVRALSKESLCVYSCIPL